MIDFSKLREPFPPQDVEWRLQECGKKGDKIWAMCLAYITNRAIMQRLDDVCGPDNWKNQYQPGPQGGVVCGLSIRCNDEWITKWDGADNTQVEATKGGLSDAMKRAAVQWGIGRYLYNLEAGFATIAENGEYRGKTKDNTYFKWNPPKLPAWALPAQSAPPAKTSGNAPVPPPPSDDAPKDKDAEYHDRITKALKTLYGDDKKAALDKVESLTTFIPKGKTEAERVKGVRNFLQLKGDRAKYLAHGLERLVKERQPATCPQCDGILNADGRCPSCEDID